MINNELFSVVVFIVINWKLKFFFVLLEYVISFKIVFDDFVCIIFG